MKEKRSITRRYVRPTDDGWEVIREGHRQATGRASTKAGAIKRARELFALYAEAESFPSEDGTGEIQVLDRHGKTVETVKVRAK